MNEAEKNRALPIVKNITEAVAYRATYPNNFGPLETWNGHARITGPCGDTMEYWIQVEEDVLVSVGFITDSCGHSCAAGGMAGELAEGKTTQEASTLEQKDVLESLGGLPVEHEHCALLAANVLKAAVRDYKENSRSQG